MVWTEVRSMSDAREEPGGDRHLPVLAREVVALFAGLDRSLLERGAVESDDATSEAGAGGGWIVDGTLGLGGHAFAVLEALPTVRLLGIDQDEHALARAGARLEPFASRVRLRQGRMSELGRIVRKERIGRPIGVLFDLGVSSMQLDRAERGFSFQNDGPLDMRMDQRRDRTAADIVNGWDESDLADLFYYEGEETRARVIAHAIVEARHRAPFRRTLALADLIARTTGQGGKIHPATRVFQALRRAVNEEGDELLEGLFAAMHWLAKGGRLVVISFHSLEDAETKRCLLEGSRSGAWKLLTKKPLVAERDEVRSNPRSRSAKVRAAERIGEPGRIESRDSGAEETR